MPAPYLYNLPNNTTGYDQIVVQTINAVPSFVPLLLTFIFFVVFLGGVSRQKARTGTADYPMWMTLASLTILITSLIFTTGVGFINTTGILYLVIPLAMTIIFAAWLFLDRRAGEI